MSYTRVKPVNNLLVLYCFAVSVSIFGFLSADAEMYLLRFVAIAVTLAHLHYGICLVSCCFFVNSSGNSVVVGLSCIFTSSSFLMRCL